MADPGCELRPDSQLDSKPDEHSHGPHAKSEDLAGAPAWCDTSDRYTRARSRGACQTSDDDSAGSRSACGDSRSGGDLRGGCGGDACGSAGGSRGDAGGLGGVGILGTAGVGGTAGGLAGGIGGRTLRDTLVGGGGAFEVGDGLRVFGGVGDHVVAACAGVCERRLAKC